MQITCTSDWAPITDSQLTPNQAAMDQAAVDEEVLAREGSWWSREAQRAAVCRDSLLVSSLHLIDTAAHRDLNDSAAFLGYSAPTDDRCMCMS